MATYRDFTDAVERGDLKLMEDLIKEGGFNLAEKPTSLLPIVARKGFVDVLNRLLEIPEFINHPTALRFALNSAAENGHSAVVKRLLEIDSVVNAEIALICAVDKNGWVPSLSHAVWNGDIDVLNQFLKIPAFLNNVTYNNNFLLNGAAVIRHREILYLLVNIPAVCEHDIFPELKSTYPIIEEALQHNLLVKNNMFELLKLNCICEKDNKFYLSFDLLLIIAENIPGYFPPGIEPRSYLTNEIERAREEIENNSDTIMTDAPPIFAPDLKRKRDENDDEGPSHSDDQPIAKRTRSKNRS